MHRNSKQISAELVTTNDLTGGNTRHREYANISSMTTKANNEIQTTCYQRVMCHKISMAYFNS